ncbi:MAG: hypothetical protein ABI658_12215 [Acidimicrobiales bacterium]
MKKIVIELVAIATASLVAVRWWVKRAARPFSVGEGAVGLIDHPVPGPLF